jgi:hypothetical protein
VGRAGVPLVEAADGSWRCPQTDELYAVQDGELRAAPGPE